MQGPVMGPPPGMMMAGPPPPGMMMGGPLPPGVIMGGPPPPGVMMGGPPPGVIMGGPPPQGIIMGGPPPRGGPIYGTGPPPQGVIMGGPPQHGGPPGGPPPPQSVRMPPPQQGPPPSGPRGKHIPLARCRVLYLGSAVPLETAVGLEAVQQPLRERYSGNDGDVPGIDAWCTVFSSGIQMQYVEDRDNVTWFPIQTLHVCAAAKCVVQVDGSNGKSIARFVALDSEAAKGSQHPPMFSAIMRRTKGVKVLECHAFICKSDPAAMAMVHAATHAYEHKEGWCDDAPPVDAIPHEPHLIPAEPSKPRDASDEFYKKPPPHGYYYSNNKGLIKHYNVMGGDKEEPPRRGPTSEMGRPTSPGPMMPPGPGGRPPMLMPVGGVPPGIPPPGAPGATLPLPPGPILGAPQPYMLPPPPRGYFNDWDRFGGRPIAIFGDDYGPDDYDRRAPRGRGRRRRSRRRYRSGSPHYRSESSGSSSSSSSSDEYDERPRRRRRDSRDRRDRDKDHRPRDRGYERREPDRGRDYDREYDRAPPRGRRPNTPPADYGYPDRASDLQLFAPRYNNEGDDYFYRKNTGPSALERELSPSRYNPEIMMKRDERDRGRSPPPGRRDMSPRGGRDLSPRGARDRDLSPRHFPSADRNFGQSIREERRATGGYGDRGPDPYKLNNYSKQYDDEDDYGRYAGRGEARRMRNFMDLNGYLP